MAPAPQPSAPVTPEDINRLASAFQQSKILLSAIELDIFSSLSETEARSAEAVARSIGADARGTDRLLRALAGLGFVACAGEGFLNTRASQKYLSRESPAWISSLGHLCHLYSRWDSLPRALKNGGTVLERNTQNRESREDFIEAMHSRARVTADDLVAQVELAGVRRMLDVGGGSGVYSMAFCRASKGLASVVLDQPEVVGLTRGYVAREGFADRIEVVAGDYLRSDFGRDFDLVFFSAIIHINSALENALLMRKAFDALNPGGRVAVQDFIMDEDRTSPLRGAIFALNMLVNTPGGDTYTGSEVRDWLGKAGFTGMERLDTGPNTAMIVGVKPA